MGSAFPKRIIITTPICLINDRPYWLTRDDGPEYGPLKLYDLYRSGIRKINVDFMRANRTSGTYRIVFLPKRTKLYVTSEDQGFATSAQYRHGHQINLRRLNIRTDGLKDGDTIGPKR